MKKLLEYLTLALFWSLGIAVLFFASYGVYSFLRSMP
jgi:hypothetical protein